MMIPGPGVMEAGSVHPGAADVAGSTPETRHRFFNEDVQ